VLMKILCLNGSPRIKGNTADLLDVFKTTAEELGADVSVIHLNRLTYEGCQACMNCKGKTEYCTVKDDLTPVLEETRESNVLVLGSPIYFGDVSAQLKGFIDRTYSFMKPEFSGSRLERGKTLVMILPQGAEDESHYNDVYPRYAGFFKWFGYQNRYEIRGLGIGDPGDAKKDSDLLERVRNVAREIAA
jgi:multimeric flavodoxin WrbA